MHRGPPRGPAEVALALEATEVPSKEAGTPPPSPPTQQPAAQVALAPEAEAAVASEETQPTQQPSAEEALTLEPPKKGRGRGTGNRKKAEDGSPAKLAKSAILEA